jgi:hypothetical protein
VVVLEVDRAKDLPQVRNIGQPSVDPPETPSNDDFDLLVAQVQREEDDRIARAVDQIQQSGSWMDTYFGGRLRIQLHRRWLRPSVLRSQSLAANGQVSSALANLPAKTVSMLEALKLQIAVELAALRNNSDVAKDAPPVDEHALDEALGRLHPPS